MAAEPEAFRLVESGDVAHSFSRLNPSSEKAAWYEGEGECDAVDVMFLSRWILVVSLVVWGEEVEVIEHDQQSAPQDQRQLRGVALWKMN